MVWALFFTVIFVWAVLRRFHHRFVALKFKYRLYELRDELRRDAIQGGIDKDSWLFNYFDNTLSVQISQSYKLTLFRAIYLHFLYSENAEINTFRKKLDEELAQNSKYQDLYDRYAAALISYMFYQHDVSGNFIYYPIRLFHIVNEFITKRFKNWSKNYFIYPETSDYSHFAA